MTESDITEIEAEIHGCEIVINHVFTHGSQTTAFDVTAELARLKKELAELRTA